MTEVKKSPFYILFVDDEDNARKYFEKGLKHNFNVLTASNVDDAQKIIVEKSQEIAVVITDQRMPGGNGIKLLRFLRENHPKIIRLLTTAYSDLTEAIDAVNSGEIFRYIQKPWDFHLLQTELKQALDLFELRLEYNKLLHEKMMVKVKMIKTDRARSVILMAKSLNFIRFADASAQRFIKQFATNIEESDNGNDWDSFDFGGSDVAEVRFFLSVMDKVQSVIPSLAGYDFDRSMSGSQTIALLEQSAAGCNLSTKVKLGGQTQDIKVNNRSFELLAKKIMQLFEGSGVEISATVSETEGAASIAVEVSPFSIPEKSNIFAVPPSNLKSDFYINLLICYFLVGHHGGTTDLAHGNNKLHLTIKLPHDPERPILSAADTSAVSLENTILATILC